LIADRHSAARSFARFGMTQRVKAVMHEVHPEFAVLGEPGIWARKAGLVRGYSSSTRAAGSCALRCLCCLVNPLRLIPNAREFAAFCAKVFQRRPLRPRLTASLAPAPVQGSALESIFRVKCRHFSPPSSCSTIQHAESQRAHTRATLSGWPAYSKVKILLGNKLPFFAVAIVPCKRKVNPVSVKRYSCYGKGTIGAPGASPRRVHWVERSRKLKKTKG